MLGRSPFDDQSGQEFLQWFAHQGGVPSAVFDNVSPAGTDLAGATQLDIGLSVIRATAANAGVRLPDAAVGALVQVVNADGADTIKIWPNDALVTLDLIGLGVGLNTTLAAGATAQFTRVSSTEWLLIKP